MHAGTVLGLEGCMHLEAFECCHRLCGLIQMLMLELPFALVLVMYMHVMQYHIRQCASVCLVIEAKYMDKDPEDIKGINQFVYKTKQQLKKKASS